MRTWGWSWEPSGDAGGKSRQGQLSWNTGWWYFSKMGVDTSALGVHAPKTFSETLAESMYEDVQSGVVYTGGVWKATKCPSLGEWIVTACHGDYPAMRCN